MTLVLFSLALLVDGHHPLPLRPAALACRDAAPVLRQTLKKSRRPQRQRALVLLWRCGLPLPLEALRNDADPELRLSAWRLTLNGLPFADPRWQLALEGLPASQRRSILAWRRRLRASVQNPHLDRTAP